MFSTFISSFSPPLNKKIEESLRIINLAYAKYQQNNCIFFNGGKDSTVLLDLVYKYHTGTKVGQKYPLKSFFLQSSDEYPEMNKYINDVKDYWKHDFQIIETSSLKYGLSKIIDKYSIKGIFLGVRKSDPEGKNSHIFEPTSNGYPKAMRILPLLNWDYKDVWSYIDKVKIPVCELYSKGYTSIGSPSTTQPNPQLYDSITKTYKHARELQNDNLERIGRN
ncbi:3'-phosphoadenosine 5'-phosphosulfate sulfotransferase [Tritrichomonas musculus]|uniref:FAD synthase n=1 Tax=Tritrichomonas musculus TaxID=1915356 RepID=A0ABR2HA89_9EUKA